MSPALTLLLAFLASPGERAIRPVVQAMVAVRRTTTRSSDGTAVPCEGSGPAPVRPHRSP